MTMLGRCVLLSYLLGFLGVLFVGQTSMILALPGFVLTVAVGLFGDPGRRPLRRGFRTPSGTSPFKAGALLVSAVAGILLAIGLMEVLSSGRGTPNIGRAGLLAKRDQYTLSTRRSRTETPVERWRFVSIGLLFSALWFGGSSAAAWLVFARQPPSTPTGGA